MTPPRTNRRSRSHPRRRSAAWSRAVTLTPEWAAWRREVFRRDGYRCVMCPKTAAALLVFRAARRHLEPHHILRKIDHPELMYEVSNGVTLCNHCHEQVTDREKEFEGMFRAYIRKLRRQEEALADFSGMGFA